MESIIDHGCLDPKTKTPRLLHVQWKSSSDTEDSEWQELQTVKSRFPTLVNKYLQDNSLGKYHDKEKAKKICTELPVRKTIVKPVRRKIKTEESAATKPSRRRLSPEIQYSRSHSYSHPLGKREKTLYTGTLQLTTGETFCSLADPYDPKADLWVYKNVKK